MEKREFIIYNSMKVHKLNVLQHMSVVWKITVVCRSNQVT